MRRGFLLTTVRHGDWQSRLMLVTQALIGAVALIGLIGMITLHPYWLLGFSAAQGLAVLGILCFGAVALSLRRTLVLEEYSADDVIFRQGDPGRDMYVIKSGTVEFTARDRDGREEVLRQLGPGDHFGEMALIGKAPRSATARAVTAVEVLKMSGGSFAALYMNLPGLREHFNTVMKNRLEDLRARKQK